MKPVTELSDDELTEACAIECLGWHRQMFSHWKTQRDDVVLIFWPLGDWNDTMLVKFAAEEMTGEDICFGKGMACLRDDGGYPVKNVSHENTRRAVLCVALSAVRAKKGSVQS